MANTIHIIVDDIATTLTEFDQIQVFRAASQDGTFLEITDASDRIDLNAQDNLYFYVDDSGGPEHWYKTGFFNSTTTASGVQSDAFQPSTLQQLTKNMEVRVELDDDLAGLNGVSLADDTTFYFTTKYDPLYCSAKALRLRVGGFVSQIPEDTLNLAIFEASLEADVLTFVKDASIGSNPKYIHARRQWTCCTAGLMLINNLIGGGGSWVRSKSLADFSVSYDTIGVENMIEQLMRCKMTWEPQLNSGFAALQKPAMVIKGAKDPDRPSVGRMWSNTVNPRIPAGQGKIRLRGSRRYRKFGIRPTLRGWWDTSD